MIGTALLGDKVFIRRLLIAIALAALAVVLWRMRAVLLMVFAAVLLAVLLRAGAEPLGRVSGLSSRWSLAIVAVGLAGLFALCFGLFGPEILAQVDALGDRVNEAVLMLERQLGVDDLAERVAGRIGSAAPDMGTLLYGLAGVLTTTIGLATNLVLVVIGGLYLAASPGTYRKGVVALVPPGSRDQVDETMRTAGRALRLWLLGQLVSMLIVGAPATLGLWLLGVPSPLALGLLAGLAEFVPLVGPIVAAIPALFVAATGGLEMFLWVAGLYLAIQQLESNFVTPLVQQRAVDLPPALTLFAVLAFGVVLGPLGLVLAVPLTVVALVAVEVLYLRNTLGDEPDVPGGPEA